MKRTYFIIIAFILVLAVVVGFQSLNKSDENRELLTPTLIESVSSTSNLEPQTNNEGPVAVTVAPHKSASAGIWEFEITLETHSVELNEDLMKAAVLIADNKNYEPIAWDGDPPGGHHRKGILQFAPTSSQPQSITLKILGVGGVDERNFTWQIK